MGRKPSVRGNPIPTRFDEPDEVALDDLHKHTGLEKATIIRRAVKLLMIEIHRRMDAGWILTELGPPLPFLEAAKREAGMQPAEQMAEPKNVVSFPRPTTKQGTVFLRALGAIAAGDGDSVDDLTEYHMELPASIVDGAAFALRVRGDSMNLAPEGIQNGDVVLMALRPFAAGQIVAAIVDGKTTLKRVIEENGQLVLKSESSNAAHGKIFPVEDMRCQGVFVGKVPKDLLPGSRTD